MQVTRSWTVLTAGSTGGLDVKIKGRTDDGSMRQLNDWLAELREDGPTEPAVPVGGEHQHDGEAAAERRHTSANCPGELPQGFN